MLLQAQKAFTPEESAKGHKNRHEHRHEGQEDPGYIALNNPLASGAEVDRNRGDQEDNDDGEDGAHEAYYCWPPIHVIYVEKLGDP